MCKDESYEFFNLDFSKGQLRKILDIPIPGSFEGMEFVTIPMLKFDIVDKYILGYGPICDNFGWRDCFECRELKNGKKIWGTTIEDYERNNKPFLIENGCVYLVTTKNKKEEYIYQEVGKSLECRSLSTGERLWSQPINEINPQQKFTWKSHLILTGDKIILVREIENTGDVLIYQKKDGILINKIQLPFHLNARMILPVIQNKYLIVSQSGNYEYEAEKNIVYHNGKEEEEKIFEDAKGTKIHFIDLQSCKLIKTITFSNIIYALPFNTLYNNGEYYFSAYSKNGGMIIIVNPDFPKYKLIKSKIPLMSFWKYKGRIIVGGYNGIGELKENKIKYFIFKRKSSEKIDFNEQLSNNYNYLLKDKILWQHDATLDSYDLNTGKIETYLGNFVGYDTQNKTLVTKEKRSFSFVFFYYTFFQFRGYKF